MASSALSHSVWGCLACQGRGDAATATELALHLQRLLASAWEEQGREPSRGTSWAQIKAHREVGVGDLPSSGQPPPPLGGIILMGLGAHHRGWQ